MARRRLTFLMTGRKAFAGRTRAWWAAMTQAFLGASLLVTGVVLLAIFITLSVVFYEPGEPYVPLWTLALQILVGLGLILVGTYQMLSTLWRVGASQERRRALVSRAGEIELLNELKARRSQFPTVPAEKYPPVRGENLPFQLFGSQRSAWGFASSAVLAALFTPLATILIVTCYVDWQAGRADWPALGLAVALSLAALWALYQFLRQWLRMTGVGLAALEISHYPLAPGRTYQLHVHQPGKIRLRLFEVDLVCEEQVTYNEGTDIRTERTEVYRSQLLRKRGVELKPYAPFEETFALTMPADAMHSFKSENNQIQWKIVIHASAPGWPIRERSFVISVVPPNSAVAA